MANYRMLIQYEGTRYRGFQRLADTDATIQGKLEAVLSKMTGEPVNVIGAGRTDAGVHAKGQVANAHFATNLSERDILHDINTYLPQDIAVLSVEKVAEDFHSRYHAKEKCYEYRILTDEISRVFARRLIYEYGKEPDVAAMRRAAAYLVGRHDFGSFCGRKMKKKSPVREIYEISVEQEGNEVRFVYRGSGFLFHMIRIMTGTLLEVGEGKRRPEDMAGILAAKNRECAGPTLPAKGLTLVSVSYESNRATD